MPTETSTPAPTQLFIGDNGRITCAASRCAGATAFYSKMKRDLSGGPMEKMRPEDVDGFLAEVGIAPKCETCGAEQSRLVVA